MKLVNTQCLLAILSFIITTTVLAEDDRADIISTDDQCNIFLKFPIGGTPKQLLLIFGEPTSKRDISILTYTWRIDDNFITLQFDRDSLTSVEIDKACEGVENNEACDLFNQYKEEWPALNVVEAKLGKPIEKGAISREEWLYKGKTEKAYIELQNDSVENIECIPVIYKYKFHGSESEESNEEIQEDYLKDIAPSGERDNWGPETEAE